jgi:hypothetical protein
LVAQIAFSPKAFWSYAMQHEEHDYEGDNLAEIWQNAQHRRTQDIYFWFTHFFGRQRQIKSSDSGSRYGQGRAAKLVLRILKATQRSARAAN